MPAQATIATHSRARGSADDLLIRAVEHCCDCAQACTACADACRACEQAGRNAAGGIH